MKNNCSHGSYDPSCDCCLEEMHHIEFMMMCDYCACYELEIDSQGEFVRLLHVWDTDKAQYDVESDYIKRCVGPPKDTMKPIDEAKARELWPAYRDRFKPKNEKD